MALGLVIDLVDAKNRKKEKKEKKEKGEKGDSEDSEDDDEEDVEELEDEIEGDSGGRKDCIDDFELRICNEECDGNIDCNRQSHDMECDTVCREQCRYIEDNKTRKCIVNLTALVSDFRSNGRGGGRGGGGGGGGRN